MQIKLKVGDTELDLKGVDFEEVKPDKVVSYSIKYESGRELAGLVSEISLDTEMELVEEKGGYRTYKETGKKIITITTNAN